MSCVAAKHITFSLLRLLRICVEAAIRSTVFVPRSTSSTKQSTGGVFTAVTSRIRFSAPISTI